jgi:hypothetical protein
LFYHPFITGEAILTTDHKTEFQTFLDGLDYDTQVTPSPPAQSATPRRDKYLARLTPLHERLHQALLRFSAELTADGLHMDQVWPLVLGRQREKPRAFEVAAALRALGWQRIRYYQDSGPSTTLWFPPEVDSAEAKAAMKARKS